MQVIVSRKDLSEAIALVSSTVSPRSTAPILTNLLLTAKGDKLVITGTDLEAWMQVEAPAAIKGAGSITLPSRRLSEIVAALPEADISIATEGTKARITCARADFSLLGMDADDYPELPTFTVEQKLTLPRDVLLGLVDKTLFAVSDEEKRYALNGILTQVEGAELRMVSTDGYRLSFAKATLAEPASANIELIVPAKAARELAKILTGEGTVAVELGSMHISFAADGRLLVSRLLEGRFPPYKDVIPSTYEKRAVLNRRNFMDVVRRVSLLTDDKMRQLFFEFSAGTLKVKAQNAGLGEAEEQMDIAWEGEPLEISFNSDFVQSILKSLDGDELAMEMTTHLKPALFKPTATDSHLCILTPMRL